MKKKKRFYNNKKRNRKWTEKEQGRKIDFADKYIEGAEVSSKFDKKRKKSAENTAKKNAKRQKRLKNLIAAVICIALICVGYIGMDVHITRKESAYNPHHYSETEESGIKDMSLRFSSIKVQSISLDSSVMLSAVISDVTSGGFTSITFDAKRSDGTIGYASNLASVDTFNATGSPASKPQPSVKELIANDILPIARISCYKDNIAPGYLPEAAVRKNKRIYKDENSNTYLNPDSEIAYNYIKDIVNELSGMGVSVFMLCDTELPEEVSKEHKDGFKALAQKLYNDVGNNIKLIDEKDIQISGRNKSNGKITNSAIRKELSELEKSGKNSAFYITSELETKQLKQQLDSSDITSYVIAGEE